jgi:hypothetical protein
MRYSFTKEQENTVGQKAGDKLAEAMIDAEGVDFTLARIYEIVCREPQSGLVPDQLHSRCSRALGDAKGAAKSKGFVIIKGALRHSYRAVKRTYSHTAR